MWWRKRLRIFATQPSRSGSMPMDKTVGETSVAAPISAQPHLFQGGSEPWLAGEFLDSLAPAALDVEPFGGAGDADALQVVVFNAAFGVVEPDGCGG